MSVLRWPYDRHRDLRAWLSAEAPPHARSGTNQNRHLMMPSPPIDHSYGHCHPRWLATGHAQVRIRALTGPANGPANPVMQRDDHVLTPMRSSSVCTKPDHRSRFCSTSSSPAPRLNPHSARRTAAELPTAISCLGAFPTPADTALSTTLVIAGVRKPCMGLSVSTKNRHACKSFCHVTGLHCATAVPSLGCAERSSPEAVWRAEGAGLDGECAARVTIIIVATNSFLGAFLSSV